MDGSQTRKEGGGQGHREEGPNDSQPEGWARRGRISVTVTQEELVETLRGIP